MWLKGEGGRKTFPLENQGERPPPPPLKKRGANLQKLQNSMGEIPGVGDIFCQGGFKNSTINPPPPPPGNIVRRPCFNQFCISSTHGTIRTLTFNDQILFSIFMSELKNLKFVWNFKFIYLSVLNIEFNVRRETVIQKFYENKILIQANSIYFLA